MSRLVAFPFLFFNFWFLKTLSHSRLLSLSFPFSFSPSFTLSLTDSLTSRSVCFYHSTFSSFRLSHFHFPKRSFLTLISLLHLHATSTLHYARSLLSSCHSFIHSFIHSHSTVIIFCFCFFHKILPHDRPTCPLPILLNKTPSDL